MANHLTQAAASEPKLGYVDALRGGAILAVIALHTGQYGLGARYFHPTLAAIVENGAHGVQLFFLVSAFTLFLSLSRREEEAHRTRDFFIRRLFRIAPLYWVGVVYFGWWFVQVEGRELTFEQVLSNVFFVHGIHPNWINSAVPGGWSIGVEVMFYGMVPWLYMRLRTLDRAVRFVALAWVASGVLGLVLRQWPLVENPWLLNSYLYFYLPSQLPVFGLGIVAYFLVYGPDKPTLRATTLLLVSVVVLANLGLGLAQQQKHVWFALGFVALLKALSQVPFRAVVTSPFVFIGRISYSLYLVHFAVLLALDRYGYTSLLRPANMREAVLDFGFRFLVVVFVGGALASLSYFCIEVPCQRLAKRLIARFDSLRPEASALSV